MQKKKLTNTQLILQEDKVNKLLEIKIPPPKKTLENEFLQERK